MADNGFEAAPARYTRQDRETIDRIRDDVGDWFREGRYIGLSDDDAVFYAVCRAMAMRYDDRQGAKGDPDGDREKARWYHGMALHILGVAGDPREKRPGFVPYERRGSGGRVNVALSKVGRDLLQLGHREGARSMLKLLGKTIDKIEAMALSTGPDPRMGPGPLEGASCLALNDFVRLFLRQGEQAIANMEQELG